MEFELLDNVLLAADIGDFIAGIVPVIFVIIWVISQVMGVTKNNKQPQQPDQPRPPDLDEAPPQQDLANEIEAFLRKVQGGGQTAAAPPPPPRPPTRPVVEASVVEAELFEPAPVESLPSQRAVVAGRTVSSNVAQRHLPDHHLGEDVDQSDERLERHIHDVFDHDIGGLKDTSDQIHGPRSKMDMPVEPDADDELIPEIPTTADELRDMFSDSENIRKAVILSEVFTRSDNRW